MNRLEWRQLAERWLKDAKILLDNRRWSAAYYLAGYAVECGLKACVLARVGISPEVIFGARRFSERCWTHDLEELVRLADLAGALEAESAGTGVSRPVTRPGRTTRPKSSTGQSQTNRMGWCNGSGRTGKRADRGGGQIPPRV